LATAYNGKNIRDLRFLLAEAEDEVLRLRNEMISLVRICEDVISDRTSQFPGSNIGVLVSAINNHVKNRPEHTFIELFIEEISEGLRAGSLNLQLVGTLGDYLEKIGYVDRDWYLENNGDVGANKIRAGAHYLAWGHSEKRKPNQFS
jgi:hypothetical protein